MKPLALHPEAQDEAREAARHHEKERKGYGKKVRQAIHAALKRIRQNPKAFAKYGQGPFRRCVLQTFRYNIFFAELEDYIWVAAVLDRTNVGGLIAGLVPPECPVRC